MTEFYISERTLSGRITIKTPEGRKIVTTKGTRFVAVHERPESVRSYILFGSSSLETLRTRVRRSGRSHVTLLDLAERKAVR